VKKIAPRLVEFVHPEARAARDPEYVRARRELRALLSVARAAKRVDLSGSDWDENMRRALSRLDKVSK